MKVYKLLRNCVCYATNKKSSGSGLTAIKEVSKHIEYILGDLFVFFYQCLSELRIEALTY